MTDTPGSLLRHAAAAACLCLTLAARVHAQTALPSPAEPAAAPAFLPHFNFHLGANALAINDQRFTWDTRFGGDLDIVDYVAGRFSVIADYEAILGSERRSFDPNQSVYTLETSASARAGGTELAGVFRHASRHLGDRAKPYAIDWNTLGVRVLRRASAGGATIDLQASGGRVIEHSYVDYSWTGNVDLVVRRPVSEHVAVYAHGLGEIFGIDSAISSRGAQKGGRVEVGVRLAGGAGAVELFGGVERRVDADPVRFEAESWAFAGFRLVNR